MRGNTRRSSVELFIIGSLFLGSSVRMPVASAELALGPWENPSPGTADVLDGIVLDACLYQGQIILAGNFEVLRNGQLIGEDLVAFDGANVTPLLETYDPEGWVESVYVKDGHLFFGGQFRRVDGMAVRNIAVWRDGQYMLAVGDGLPGVIESIGEFQGKLVVSTSFASRSGDPNLLHIWEGSYWSHIELPADVELGMARAFLDRGTELWVGGMFLSDGEAPEAGRSVMIWDGIDWSVPGDGLRNDGAFEFAAEIDGVRGVSAFTEYEGDVYAGGTFHDAARDIYGMARWDGASWSNLPARGFISDWVTVENGILPLGLLHAESSPAIESRGPVRWDGAQFHPLDPDPDLLLTQVPFRGLVLDGDLYLVGDSLDSGNEKKTIPLSRWDGSAWTQPLGFAGVAGWIDALITHENRVILGGEFFQTGPISSPLVSAWNGFAFEPMSRGLIEADCSQRNTLVRVFQHFDGTLVAGGNFGIRDQGAVCIGKWQGTRWESLGAGLRDSTGSLDGGVFAMTEYDGQLVVGGVFDRAGPHSVRSLATWDGAQWLDSPPSPDSHTDYWGNPAPPEVFRLAVYEGDLIAAGQFESFDGVSTGSLARWREGAWEPLDLGITGYLTDLAVWHGDLYLAHSRYEYGGDPVRLDRFDGTSLIPLIAETGITSIRGHLQIPDHLLFFGGGLWSTQGTVGTTHEFARRSNWGAFASLGPRLYGAGVGDRFSDWKSEGFFSSAQLLGVVPAVLLDLEARLHGEAVELEWTASHADLVRSFRVERHTHTTLWQTIYEGTTTVSGLIDPVPHPALWTYRLVANVDGNRIESSEVTVDTRGANLAPSRSYIRSVRPNPFNGSTTLEYTVAQSGPVSAEVYALDGRQVTVSDLGSKDVGNHAFTWNGRDASGRSVASAVYVLRLRTADQVMTRRVAYVK